MTRGVWRGVIALCAATAMAVLLISYSRLPYLKLARR